MASVGPRSRHGPEASRRIVAVSLMTEAEQVVFPVKPKPFVYREGMRLRIDVLGGQAFVADIG